MLTYCVPGPGKRSAHETARLVRQGHGGSAVGQVATGSGAWDTPPQGGPGKYSSGNDVSVSPEGKPVEKRAGPGAEGWREYSRLGNLGQRE